MSKHLYGLYEIKGKLKGFELKISHIVWNDEKALMIIISESKVVERINIMNEQSEYKDKLLATVSHNLRTPLNGITGMIRIVLDMVTDEASRRYLRVALRSSNLLLMMINDILDYSQISNEKLRLTFESFNIWDVIKDVSKLFKFQAKLKGLEFVKENLVQNSPNSHIITSDQNRLKQILFNLLGNALKFTKKGSIKITLNSVVRPVQPNFLGKKPKRAFLISVEDTGIGIKLEDQKSLFTMFGKIHNENTSSLNKTGVGLGLCISQSLVKMLNNNREGSDIQLVSEYNKGSCFSFILESQKGGEGKFSNISELSDKDFNKKEESLFRKIVRNNISKKGQIPGVEETIRNKRVLVVDDDQINILVLSAYLKGIENTEFDVVFNGEDAIKIVRTKAQQNIFFDLILMDCNMPVMNGFEASFIINQMITNGEIPSLPIIACTANASPRDSEEFSKCGMVDFLTKPYTKEEMKKKLEKYA